LSNLCSSIAADSAAFELAVAVELSVAEEGQPVSTAAFVAERPVVAVDIEVSSTGVAVTVDNGGETAAGFWSSVGPDFGVLVSVCDPVRTSYTLKHTMPPGIYVHHSWCAIPSTQWR
jgi:hypothetical protein